MHGNSRRWLVFLPLLALLAAAPGCVTEPAVTLHHAEVRGVSTYGVGVMIVLQVRNDNAYDLQIRNVHCNVIFGRGYVLGPIDFASNQWLPSNQTTMVGVPVWIPWQLIPSLASESIGSFAIPYQVKGTADVTATRAFGIQRDNYPIDQSGSVMRETVINAARSVIPIPF